MSSPPTARAPRINVILKATLVCTLSLVTLVMAFLWWCTSVSEGDPRSRPINAQRAREASSRLRRDVGHLSSNRTPSNRAVFEAATNYIRAELDAVPNAQVNEEHVAGSPEFVKNYFVKTGEHRTKESGEYILVGAHYDSADGTPGADDNASGVAVALELIRRFSETSVAGKEIVFAFFANEEPPFYGTPSMGSYAAASSIHKRNETLCFMVSLEMLGYFSSKKNSQRYPPGIRWFYPDKGNFVAMVGNVSARSLIAASTQSFHDGTTMQTYGFAGPSWIEGIDFSDHRSFWKFGYRAFTVTDTSFYRNPHYHRQTDTPETLNYNAMAQVTDGLESMLRSLSAADLCFVPESDH